MIKKYMGILYGKSKLILMRRFQDLPMILNISHHMGSVDALSTIDARRFFTAACSTAKKDRYGFRVFLLCTI